MKKQLLSVYVMTGMSREGHKYEVELCCEVGKEAESFQKHIQNIGWDRYEYKFIDFKKPKTEFIDVSFDEVNFDD